MFRSCTSYLTEWYFTHARIPERPSFSICFLHWFLLYSSHDCTISIYISEFYFNLIQKYYGFQVSPNRGSNLWHWDHDSTFHVTETPVLTSRASVKYYTPQSSTRWGSNSHPIQDKINCKVAKRFNDVFLACS